MWRQQGRVAASENEERRKRPWAITDKDSDNKKADFSTRRGAIVERKAEYVY